MSAILNWLSRKRDGCAVTYSRFGVPGDIVDDRPRPTSIYVSEFDDDDPKFIFFKLCHAQKLAIIVAGFGMSFIMLMFISAFFEFNWYGQRRGIDLIAITSLFLYIGVGLLIHYQVIVGVKKQISRFLLPFIIVYTFSIGTEGLLAFVYMLHIHTPVNFEYNDETNGMYIFSIVTFIVVMLVQGAMLAVVCKCRYYLSCKEFYTISLKVIESSKTKYPGIQAVFVPASQTEPSLPNVILSNERAPTTVKPQNGGPETVKSLEI